MSELEQLEEKEDRIFYSYSSQMLADIESLESEVPIGNSQNASRELGEMMRELEWAYCMREKLIDTVLENGTGLETREALRMLPVDTLEKWAKELSLHSR